MKRGQLTIFVIISLMIIFLLAVYFLHKNNLIYDRVNQQIIPVYDVVYNCAKEITEESINIIGESGGYYRPPQKSNANSIAYYFSQGENLMPSLEEVENQMGNYVSDMLLFCVQKQISLMPDYELYSGDINVLVNVKSDDRVYFNIEYPFNVIKNNRSYHFNKPFDISYDVKLYTIYNYAKQMILWQEEEPRAICINCITDLAFDKGLYIDLYDAEPNDVLFRISEENSLINNELFYLFFVVKYPEEKYDPYHEIFN